MMMIIMMIEMTFSLQCIRNFHLYTQCTNFETSSSSCVACTTRGA